MRLKLNLNFGWLVIGLAVMNIVFYLIAGKASLISAIFGWVVVIIGEATSIVVERKRKAGNQP